MATDTLVVSLYTSGAWSDIASLIGPSSSTDNAVARWNGAGGHTLQDSVVIVSDTGAVSGITDLAMTGILSVFRAATVLQRLRNTTLTADARTFDFRVETDGDVGSRLVIRSTNDAGTTVLEIVRVDFLTGLFSLLQGLTVAGNVTTTAASTASYASLRAPHGTAPTSPVNGDIWTTTAGLFAQINGVTVGPFMAEPAEDLITTES